MSAIISGRIIPSSKSTERLRRATAQILWSATSATRCFRFIKSAMIRMVSRSTTRWRRSAVIASPMSFPQTTPRSWTRRSSRTELRSTTEGRFSQNQHKHNHRFISIKFRRGTDTSRVVAPSLRLFIVYLSSVFRAMNGVTPSHKSYCARWAP